MNKGFFITATNTNKGKTIVTTGLTLWLRQNGYDVVPAKPIQTGTSSTELAPDLAFNFKLNDFTPEETDLPLMQSYRYTTPCSPHLAAEKDQLGYPQIEHIKKSLAKLSKKHDLILVEGAGGTLVPIDRQKKLYIIDLIVALGLPVILVAGSGLGTINDTCLAIEALQKRKIKITGFLFNESQAERENILADDNQQTITQFTGVPFLGKLPHLPFINRENLLTEFNKLTELKKILIG